MKTTSADQRFKMLSSPDHPTNTPAFAAVWQGPARSSLSSGRWHPPRCRNRTLSSCAGTRPRRGQCRVARRSFPVAPSDNKGVSGSGRLAAASDATGRRGWLWWAEPVGSQKAEVGKHAEAGSETRERYAAFDRAVRYSDENGRNSETHLRCHIALGPLRCRL